MADPGDDSVSAYIDDITSGNVAIQKKALFQLSTSLQSPSGARSLVGNKIALQALLKIAVESQGNTQTYAMRSLCALSLHRFGSVALSNYPEVCYMFP